MYPITLQKLNSANTIFSFCFVILLCDTDEEICGEVLPLSMTELMELAPRIGPRRILQKRVPQLLGYTVMLH